MTASLADRYAAAKLAADEAEAVLKVLRKEVLETGAEELLGDDYVVTAVLSERTTLDSRKVKALLTPAQIKSVSSTSVVTTLKVARLVKIKE